MKSLDELGVTEGLEFSGENYRLLCGPGVYLFMSETEALYVGMSKSVIARPFTFSHWKARKAQREATRFIIYPCRTVGDALDLETMFIERLHPKYNTKQKVAMVCRRLGIATLA